MTDRKTGHAQRACPIPFGINVLALPVAFGLAGRRVEDQDAVFAVSAEIEHLRDRVGNSVERALADARSAEPIVFDDADDRVLVVPDMVYEISAGYRSAVERELFLD